jgi:nucleoside-diphosphate-sugar epimerase
MRVLVTGNRGYIGSVMVPLLAAAGFEVIGLDTDFYSRANFNGVVPWTSTVHKDVRAVTTTDLQGFDAVVHLAALSNDALGEIDEKMTYDINAEASVRLAKAAKAAGAQRFVFLSSCSTYGASGDDFLTEEAEFNPVTAYGRSKVQAEQEIAKLADDQFSPTFLRSATAYGVSPRLRLDIVLNNLVAWAYTTGKVKLSSNGLAYRPLVHIEDISRAVIATLSVGRERVHNQAFNVGLTAENYRIRDVAAIVRDAVPGSSIEMAEGAASDARWYRVDCRKIAALLPEFRPQWTLAAGARQLYEAYRDASLTLADVEGPRFMRIAQLRALMSEGRLQGDLRWREAA